MKNFLFSFVLAALLPIVSSAQAHMVEKQLVGFVFYPATQVFSDTISGYEALLVYVDTTAQYQQAKDSLGNPMGSVRKKAGGNKNAFPLVFFPETVDSNNAVGQLLYMNFLLALLSTQVKDYVTFDEKFFAEPLYVIVETDGYLEEMNGGYGRVAFDSPNGDMYIFKQIVNIKMLEYYTGDKKNQPQGILATKIVSVNE